MAPKPKAGGAKRHPAKATAKAKEKPQSERFIEAARSGEVDETGKEFERLFSKVVPPRQLSSRKSVRPVSRSAAKIAKR